MHFYSGDRAMKARRTTAFVLVIAACLWNVAAAGAAQDYSEGILDRKAVLKAAGGATLEAYPNADLVHIDDFIISRYEPDGTGVSWSDSYTKVLTEKGRREQQDMAFRFTLPYGRTTVRLLQLIRPDGSVVPIDIEKQSKVMIDRSQMGSNIYDPNSKVVQVGVPGVQIGDVVHVVVCDETLRRYMPDTWDDYQVFESTSPILHAVYEVRAPKDRPLVSIALRDEIEGTVTHSKQEQDGRIVYRWEVSNVPRFYSEPDMPPAYTVVQRLLVSTLPDWKAISSWYWGLCKSHLDATTPQMQETVDKLTAGLTDRRKKVEAIFYWVSQQVRYMGITTEGEAPGWEPHDVKMTFDNRHGVCRDKAALLVAMLRLAGIDAYPVLIDAGPKKDDEIAMVAFNHAIVAATNEDGSYQLMDCTDESTKDLFPNYLCNCSYLVAHPQGEDLRTASIVPARENLVHVETTGEIDSRGNLTAETNMKFEGINDNAYRSYFARVKPEQRRQLFEGVLKASIATASLTDFEVRPADIQDTTQALSVRLRFTAKDLLIGAGDTVMMPVPQVGARVGIVNFIIGQTGLKERRFPLQTNYACGVQEKLSLRIDPAIGSFVSLPEFAPIEDSTMSWSREFVHQAGTLEGQAEFLIKVVELDPHQYLSLKESLKQIEYNERKKPILARETSEAASEVDVVVLDYRVEYDLADAHNWTERHYTKKQVRSYKGKKDNAELKLDYNPAWEDVKLIRATVTNDGQAKEISDKEINLMDAGWAASAPRYPAAKTLVASLPAVEIGSIIEYEYERHKRDRPFFATTHIFRSSNPVEQETVSLTAPASLALRFMKDDNGLAVPDDKQPADKPVIVETQERSGEKVSWRWRVESQAAVKQEDGLAPLSTFTPVLRITAGQWDAYAGQMLAALEKAAEGQETARQRAGEIVRGAKNPEQRITAIRDFVVQNIRAAGPGCDDLPQSAITPADRTLSDGYGNTTDRAVVLYALLQEAGLKPEFVLVNYGASLDVLKQFEMQYPTPGLFGNVLIRVRDADSEVYLNDTDQYAALGATPADGELALPLAEGRPESITVAADRKNLVDYEVRLVLTEQGNAGITTTRKNYGEWFGSRRKLFTEMPPEERNRFYQEMVASVSQAAVADSDLVTDFIAYPGVESFGVHVDKYAVRDGDFLYFELPRSLGRLFGLRSDSHENPFSQDRDESLRISTIIELPPGYSHVVLAPEQRQWQLPGGGGVVRVSVTTEPRKGDSPARLVITHEVNLDPFLLEADGYAELVEIEKQLTHAKARTVLVTRDR
jgi:transglutaminase-like putative cysteine protease